MLSSHTFFVAEFLTFTTHSLFLKMCVEIVGVSFSHACRVVRVFEYEQLCHADLVLSLKTFFCYDSIVGFIC